MAFVSCTTKTTPYVIDVESKKPPPRAPVALAVLSITETTDWASRRVGVTVAMRRNKNASRAGTRQRVMTSDTVLAHNLYRREKEWDCIIGRKVRRTVVLYDNRVGAFILPAVVHTTHTGN